MPRLVIDTFEVIAGSTIKTTWVSSGVTAGAISSALIDNSGTVVHSAPGVSSGSGLYYALHPVPNTPDTWYVNEWFTTINANTYRSRSLINALLPGVD